MRSRPVILRRATECSAAAGGFWISGYWRVFDKVLPCRLTIAQGNRFPDIFAPKTEHNQGPGNSFCPEVWIPP